MSINSPQFVWPASFACTIVTEDIIIPNSYMLNISIVPVDNTPGSISQGFKKIKYFVDECLHNSVFIHSENPFAQSFKESKSNLVLFPTEPYDYFVGSILYQKFLSISKKYFHIDMISIDSVVGDNVQYSIIDPEESGLNLNGAFWWNMDSADTNNNLQNSSWGDIDADNCPRFEPRIIKGGRSED
jgi:hypothetical protein